MVENVVCDERFDDQWSEPTPERDLYLVQATSLHDGAAWSPVAWCHNRTDALDVAELWAEEYPARVLVRDRDGTVTLCAAVNPAPRRRRR